jgi:hypothetical protein
MFPYYIVSEVAGVYIPSGPYSEEEFNLLHPDAYCGIIAEDGALWLSMALPPMLIAIDEEDGDMQFTVNDLSLDVQEQAAAAIEKGWSVYEISGGNRAREIKAEVPGPEDAVFVTIGWWAGEPKAAIWERCKWEDAKYEASRAKELISQFKLSIVRCYALMPIERMKALVEREHRYRKARALALEVA